MYRDHQKGPGGPPGGSTYPKGPHGLKWEGNQPLVGWCAPLGPLLRLGLETLGVGGPNLTWGASPPTWPPPPLRWDLWGPAPPGPLYKEGGGRAAHPCPWRLPLPPVTPLPLAELGEALPRFRYFHHHAVVLLDLHQPLLPPCWIKKEETSSRPYVC